MPAGSDPRRDRDLEKPGAARLVGASGLAVLAGYALIGVSYFAWYTVVPIMAWGWLAAVGLPRISRHPALYVGLLLFVFTELQAMRLLYGGRAAAELEFWQMGRILREISRGDETVFLEPIGHIGYVSRLRVIDEVGLVTPEVRQKRAQGDGWYADVVTEMRPDLLVFRPGFLEENRAWAGAAAPFRSTVERDKVLADYRHAFSGPDYEQLPMRILQRLR